MTKRKRQTDLPEGKEKLAKITRPEPIGVFPRVRLFRELDRARVRPIVWLSAPAGSGKTTLIASYFQTRGLRTLWYQMEAGDNDLASFFYYMGLGTQAVAPKHRDPMPLLTREYQAGIPVFTINYFRELFARLKSPGIVVLDNYQEVAVDGNIQEIVQLGLEQIPSGVNVVVVSRETPPSGFARSLARERIALLDWQQLQLTEQESAGIVKLRRKQFPYTHATIHRLHRDTQGWVAGLILLAESTEQELAEYSQFQSRTNRSIFDYFASEIFRRSDRATQDFLLKTAFLSVITASVAQSLTGVEDAQFIFDSLVQRNLFTFRRVEGSFEYHPLFRAFLVEQANTRFTKEQLKDLKQRAAQLLAKGGEFEAAVSLLQEAEDWEAALQAIVAHAPSLAAQGRTQTIEAWLTGIPELIRCENPRALYWQGISCVGLAPVKARAYFEKAFALFEKQSSASSLYLAWSAIIDSYLLEMSDYHPMLTWLDRYPRLGHGRGQASSSVEDASIFMYVFALLAAGADRADIHAYAQRASTLLENETNENRYISRAIVLIPYFLWRGDVVKARELLERLAPHIEKSSTRPYTKLNWYMSMSLYSAMTGASDDSQRYAREALATAGASGVHSVDQQILIYSIRGELSLGNTIAARVLLGRLATITDRKQVKSAYYSHHASLVALHEGDLERAVDEGNRAVEFSRAGGLFIGTITSLIGLAFVYAQRKEAESALEIVGEVKLKAWTFRSHCFVSYCALCEAVVYESTGNRSELLRSLSEALSLAREGNFVTPAYCPRDTAARLYAVALEHHIESDYVNATITKTHLSPPLGSMPERWPWRLRIYSLGRFIVVREGVLLEVSGEVGSKMQKKPLELLRALAAFGGRDVGIAKLTQTLWPDTDGNKARTTLRSTLLRLRRLIGEEAIMQKGSYLSLNPKHCWLDVWALEQLADHREVGVTPYARAERLFHLYRGAFLPDEDEPWLIKQRDRLRSKALRLAIECGEELEADGQVAVAAGLYEKGIEADPLAEGFYRNLMRCYFRLNRQAAALALYRRCRATLRRSLQMEPAAETMALYREIKEHAVRRSLLERI